MSCLSSQDTPQCSVPSKLQRRPARAVKMEGLGVGQGRRGPRPKPVEMRFWSKVRKGKPDECWEWTGAMSHGYGAFFVNWKCTVIAHRMAYMLCKGPVPETIFVCHHCDNPKCVNPDHLFLGNHADNMHDGWSKERFPYGENHSKAKLSFREVSTIRRIGTRVKQRVLASLFGVSRGHISEIIHLKTRTREGVLSEP